ncbi:helix-turn-helix domain-containing protein [Geomonas subterranea]|uniref:Helix-turn-helix domain-containing protein n=1 Tax=Geomonas subterranea TaxID=2847989 RepID=A0ABX8LIB4_9BACT|nr:helix-turn-helix transcriptional regulator [Geomonas subterranea]QXE89978.1 helix-turn-helix domain-containing protein [Geomonas subterranea]QXM07902.1 helix-turn-helix domain-containing protein [Geomonas subterranea]
MGKTYPRVIELLNREFGDKKVTKYAFCKATTINPTSVERYLHGISEPSQASLEKIANYFGVTVSWLRGENEEGDGSVKLTPEELWTKAIESIAAIEPGSGAETELIEKMIAAATDKLKQLKTVSSGAAKKLKNQKH